MHLLLKQNKGRKWHGWLPLFCCLVLLLGAAKPSFAKSIDSSSKLIDYLIQEKINLNSAINDEKLLSRPKDKASEFHDLKRNESLMVLNKAKITSLENFLVNQNKLQQDFTQRLKRLQQQSTQLPVTDSFARMGKLGALKETNKKTIELIQDNLNLANHYQDLLALHNQNLKLWKSETEMNEQLDKLRKEENKFELYLSSLLGTGIQLQQKIKAQSSYLNEAKLLLNNQAINLTEYKIAELDLQKKLIKADFLLLKKPDIRTLQMVTETYKTVINQLSIIEQSLKKMLSILKAEQQYLTDNSIRQQFKSVIRIVNSRIAGVVIQQQTLQEDLETHEQELKKQLSVRQGWSEYRLLGWPAIADQVLRIPTQFYNYLKSLSLKLRDNYLWQDWFPTTLLWLTLATVVLVASIFNKLLKDLTFTKERSRISGHLYDVLLNLLSRNLSHLAIVTMVFFGFYLNNIPYSSYQLLGNLIVLWFIFRSLILIARMILLERINDSSGKDVRLYYRIKWLLLAGGWTMALMVFSHELPLSLLLQDIFNRLFMLFLIAVSLVGFKSREVINHLIYPFLNNKKRYIRNAILLLVVLMPLTLFTTGVIGLIGYINLAWSLSRYQVYILLFLSAYIILRGLLFDVLELISEWMISSLRNGWLWIEVLLKPLDKILHFGLFILSVFLLFQLFGFHAHSPLIIKLKQFAEYPLIKISGIHITATSIFEFLILASIFVWASKWAREFCYRWLYREVRDVGIRNSLSAFSQYALILIGSFVTLRVLGFDFSGMSMVIGGLAVGMGFGLRDFASNVVGGLMLLIERPVRVGDLITLDNFEGQVSHIGIRSMRVSSWDNMEVLIPNAETFNKPFINWTHQDGIVRTVLPIKVSRCDDPVIVQQLILDVLAVIPEIVSDPPVQVFLKQIDEALIEFEVRYFINVQLHTRFEIRSKVLFAIIEQFKAAGIKAPVPPIAVELKESKDESFSSRELLKE